MDAQYELLTFKSDGTVDEGEYGDNLSGYLGIRYDASGKLLSDGLMDQVAKHVKSLEGYGSSLESGK